MYVRIRVIAAHFLVVLALVLVQTNPATARVTSLVDDLYKLVIKSPKYRHISYSKFTKSLRTAKLTKYADEILSFPKAEGIALQLEIAEQRGLVEGTSIIRFARTYNKIPDGDRLLLQVIDQGDRRLLDLVPSYALFVSIVVCAAACGLEDRSQP